MAHDELTDLGPARTGNDCRCFSQRTVGTQAPNQRIQAAKEKAEAMASALGMHVGKPLTHPRN
jgi:hypothetical protein